MNICTKCEREMRCETTGMIVRYGIGHCYAGDKFKCPDCEAEIVVCNVNSFHSEKEVNPEKLLQMS